MSNVHTELSSTEREFNTPELDSVMTTADSFIRRQYLSELHNACVVPLSAELSELQAGKNVRLFRLDALSYSSRDDFAEKISNIFSALSEFRSNQVLILDSDGSSASIYMGVACSETEKLSMQFDIFKSSFLGNFPGGRISVLNTSRNTELLNSIFDEENIRLSSVSALISPESTGGGNIYGIEKLIDGMYGKPFTMVLIADSIPKNEIRLARQSLEELYTQLSPFGNYSVSLNQNESSNFSESLTLTQNESVSEGTSVTRSETFGKNKNRSTSTPESEEMEKKQAKNQLLGNAISTLATLGAIMSGGAVAGGKLVISEAVGSLFQGFYFGSGISGTIGAVQTLMGNGPGAVSTSTTGEGESYSLSYSDAETRSIQKGFSSSKGVSTGVANGNGRTVQMSCENKPVADLLQVLDMQIKRLQKIEGRGGFGCAAYFVTGDNTTAVTAANMYRSLLQRGNDMGQETAINVWSDSRKIGDICSYLKLLEHPVFHFEKRVDYPKFNAGAIVAADELPLYISLPKRSVRGLTSAPHAEFAREVTDKNSDTEDSLRIGRIYHMGKPESSVVSLSRNALRGHLFAAGSTGAGKSNFSYGLLTGLYNDGVKFMVIEPAKGEYHRVCGGLDDVEVFGTNMMMKMPLLRINPFSFPEGVHVNEHIDRLLGIFNSCWPMYAAMPAVLKDGVETIYKNCGYNMITGRAAPGSRFPTFRDLLDILPQIIQKSEFSGEVKGNYIGSLVTRIKSLTDGLFACIFTEDEIDNETLFDGNTIIDLSRVGAGETKSLIMGLLIMKLQEYRMAKGEMNVPLRHVTLIEEAHHLLRGNAGPSSEGVNLRAMSLEMITNAIAEMRTYGEGFVIADQSPALMDPAVIRNTNTKVIFKLQENADRMAVAPSLSLSEEQAAELSRLETGVAAVYQSNWDNAVLAKIDRFDEKNYKPYEYDGSVIEAVDSLSIYSQCLAISLRGLLKGGEQSSADRSLCEDILSRADCADESAKKFLPPIAQFVKDSSFYPSRAKTYMYADMILDSAAMIRSCGESGNIGEWYSRSKEYISSLAALSEPETARLISMCLEIRKKDSADAYNLYYRYMGYMLRALKMQL